MDTELYQPSQQPAASAPPAAVPDGGQIHCPSCSSTQFFGGRKTSGWGWFWLVAAILNFFVSLPLMLVGIGFVTVILTPLMAIGFHVCKKHVNTCARCKRDF